MSEMSEFVRGLLPGGDPASGNRIPAPSINRLPGDTVAAGRVMAGVHIALAGTADSIELEYRMGTEVGFAAPALKPALTVRVVGAHSTAVPIAAPEGRIEVPLPSRPADATVRIYLPETNAFEPLGISANSGVIAPVRYSRRWVVYGDSICQGWSVSEAGLAWPSLVAERLSIDAVNLGFAGSARGELEAAAVVAASGADAVAIAWGTNSWATIPMDPGLIAETMRVFLATVRRGLPGVPIVVMSPIVRPGAEAAKNRLGATLAQLRFALEAAVEAIDSSPPITLIRGLDLLTPEDLVDGIHPGDKGHAALAAAVLPTVARQLAGCP
ncbi:SGNH/GDSL hydrolase family protein [Nocardia nova]|uniref:SGNH/GDSL hydrolase family protein n=1 Tax=Nocardia nova TaxID=37330 RepID=UPI000CEA405B|nr:SGNH/GDSL hydrolase family protein [Nocardia nova]PPJ25758.1 GDSL family lipase [Nocardia nova]